MKKQLLLSIILIASLTAVHAQIPNPSFENWTGGNPDNWYTGNYGNDVFVTQVNTAHAGSSAAKNSVLTIYGFSFSAPFSLGSTGTGVITATAPEAVHGWYIMNSVSNDYVDANVGMLQSNNYTGAGFVKLTNTSVYKEFVINVYYTSGTPNGDSLIFIFLMTNDSSAFPHSGSYYIIDDLSFGLQSAVEDAGKGSFEGLENIFPNPCSEQAQIIYDINEPGETNLGIYDMSGRMVMPLVNEKQTPGRYKVIPDFSLLPSGTYICRLMSGSVYDYKKVVVQ